MLIPVFDKFVEKSPMSVMSRAMIERVLNPDQLNQWFDMLRPRSHRSLNHSVEQILLRCRDLC